MQILTASHVRTHVTHTSFEIQIHGVFADTPSHKTYREMRPLFFAPARPMNVEWKMMPYLGVLLFVFSALWGKEMQFIS